MQVNKKIFNSLLFTVLTCIVIVFLFSSRNFSAIISWDTFGQYCYLPNLFIDHTFQLPLSHYQSLNSTYNFSSTLYQFNSIAPHIVYTKYTSGIAVLSIPFFLIGHLFAYILGYPMDGYSSPYVIAFGISCLFYTLLGLFILRKVLQEFFTDTCISWLIPLLVFGTNFFFHAVYGGTFTHTFAFTFLSIVILKTIHFHRNPTAKNGLLLGLSIGFLGLIRLPDLLFALLPLFWNTKQYGGGLKKIKYFLTRKRKVVIITALGFLAIISLQLIYWKITTGHFLINSYSNNNGEGLDWFHPHTIPFLFSFKKGWFLYTPLGLLGCWGLINLWKKNINGRILVITFLVFLYVVSAWTTWWYAQSYSQRAMIDIYPIFIISLGYLLTQKKIRRWLILPICLFVVLNLFQSWQMNKSILSGSQMTKAYYFSTFGQTSAPTKAQKKLLELNYIDFYPIPLNKLNLRFIKEWKFQLDDGQLDENNATTKNIYLQLQSYEPSHLYLFTAQWYYDPDTYRGFEGIIPNICAQYHGKSYTWRGESIGSPRLTVDTLNHSFTMEYLVPILRTPKDKIRIQTWRNGNTNIHLTAVKVRLYQIKRKK